MKRIDALLFLVFGLGGMLIGVKLSGELGYMRGLDYLSSQTSSHPDFYSTGCFWLGQETMGLGKRPSDLALIAIVKSQCVKR